MLKTLMDKAGSMQGQAGNASREMKILRTTKRDKAKTKTKKLK